MASKTYLCIDLKSFYASVECVDAGLDPMSARLVVADESRGDTTICLAVTPALKALGVPSRPRLFQVPRRLHPIIAPPRMKRYMDVSSRIYGLYLKRISPADIHVYSIDECFIDATPYLSFYGLDARGLANLLREDVCRETGIYATVGIGPNLFLAKIALDITAKHSPDFIGEVDERTFRETLWFHRPLTDIWGIGPGIARRLAAMGAHNLAGVAALPSEALYREFGANAEYLIDHAWGQEPCTIAEIQAYEPESTSMTNGQVLPCDYSYEEARMVMHEMIDESVLEIVEHGRVVSRISLSVGYARGEGAHGARDLAYPHTAASRVLGQRTDSRRVLMERFDELFGQNVRRNVPIRRIVIGLGDLVDEAYRTRTLFDDEEADEKERNLQEAIVDVRHRFGKNALLKATSLKDKATAIERNSQIGGHRA